MSGGHYNYQYQSVRNLADDIERELAGDFKYKEEDYSEDRLADATPEQRGLIIEEVTRLISDLKSIAARSKEFEWYVSGDTGATTYLKRLEELNEV